MGCELPPVIGHLDGREPIVKPAEIQAGFLFLKKREMVF
jgi:hypothetical protein